MIEMMLEKREKMKEDIKEKTIIEKGKEKVDQEIDKSIEEIGDIEKILKREEGRDLIDLEALHRHLRLLQEALDLHLSNLLILKVLKNNRILND